MQLFRRKPEASQTRRGDDGNRRLPTTTSPTQQRATNGELLAELQAISPPKVLFKKIQLWIRGHNDNDTSSAPRVVEDVDTNDSRTRQPSIHDAGVVQRHTPAEVETHHESITVPDVHITPETQELCDQVLTEPIQQGDVNLDQTQEIRPADVSLQTPPGNNHEERNNMPSIRPPASSVNPTIGLIASSVSEQSTSHTLSPVTSSGPSRGLSSNTSVAVSQATSQTTTDTMDQPTSSTISPAAQQHPSQALIETIWQAAWPNINSFQLKKGLLPIYQCKMPIDAVDRSVADALENVCKDALASHKRTRSVQNLVFCLYLCGSSRDCIPRQTMVVYGPRDCRRRIENIFETNERIKVHLESYNLGLLYVPVKVGRSAMSSEEYAHCVILSWRLVMLVLQYWSSESSAAVWASLWARRNVDSMLAQGHGKYALGHKKLARLK